VQKCRRRPGQTGDVQRFIDVCPEQMRPGQRDQLLVGIGPAVFYLEAGALLMPGIMQEVGLVLDQFDLDLVRAAAQMLRRRVDILLAMPMVTQQDPGLLAAAAE
jgi:hypothetical protein